MKFVVFFRLASQGLLIKKKNHVSKLIVKYHNYIDNFKLSLSLNYLHGHCEKGDKAGEMA